MCARALVCARVCVCVRVCLSVSWLPFPVGDVLPASGGLAGGRQVTMSIGPALIDLMLVFFSALGLKSFLSLWAGGATPECGRPHVFPNFFGSSASMRKGLT